MRTAFLTLFAIFGLICSPVMAQSTADLDESQKAVLMFDINMESIRGSKLAEALDLKDKIEEMVPVEEDSKLDPNTISRISGAMSAPEDMAAAKELESGKMTMDFFVKIEFNDAEAVAELIAKADEKSAEKFEQDGETYYRPPADEDAPEGMVMHVIDDTTIEMGTETYLFLKTRQVFTDGLSEAWSKVPKDDAVRIAFDLEGAQGLISEAVEEAMDKADNPMAQGYLELVDNAKNLRLSLDFSGKGDLLTIGVTGVNESDAEELRDGLNSILAMPKLMGGGQLEQLPLGIADVAGQLLDALNAEGEGAEVGIVIPYPEGLDEAVKQAMEMFGGAMIQ